MWQQIDKENRRFRAQSIPSFIEKPFIPKKSTKPLTEMNEVQLHTATRAAERRVLEEQMKEREKIDEMVREKKRKEDMVSRRRFNGEHKVGLVGKREPTNCFFVFHNALLSGAWKRRNPPAPPKARSPPATHQAVCACSYPTFGKGADGTSLPINWWEAMGTQI